MRVIAKSARPGWAAARDLCGVLQGEVAMPGDAAFIRARKIWNGAVTHEPALFALCETQADVQAAVRAARTHGLPLSVRGGGHDWAGRALRHGGLVIDLSAMRHVAVDPHSRVATVAGGATSRHVIAAAAPHGLAAVTGNCGAVGMAGLTLGGGYGPLSPRYGLALDNLLGVEIVRADGRLVAADESENVDLFWALRGGGGNFGVVTSMRVRLHPAREIEAGLILFPWSEAETVLGLYGKVMAAAPDELAVTAGVLSAPDGTPALFLAPSWSGDAVRGKTFLAGLQRLGTPIMAQLGPMTCGDVLGMFDDHVVNGRHYEMRTRWLPDLTPSAIASLVAAGGARTSPFAAIVLHHLHGAATRIPEHATAFAMRRAHFMVEAIAAWEPSARDDTAHRQWARDLSQALAPEALPGGYANFLRPEEHDQIAHAYGGNAIRLREIKRRLDPDGVFTAIPLPG
jgi:FAD/FMN-containing dehydrogenase